MKLPVNVRALEDVLVALLGRERANIVDELYRVVEAAEERGFNEGHTEGVADGDQENYYSGYTKGFTDGNDYYLSSEPASQPHYHDDVNVASTADLARSLRLGGSDVKTSGAYYDAMEDDSLHGTAAALEPHETEQAPTPPADCPF